MIELTSENFDEHVLVSEHPFVVHFWADWCSESTAVTEVLDEIADDYDDLVDIGTVDIDANTHLANEYRIRAVPTLIFFHKGHVMRRLTGDVSRSDLEETFEQTADIGSDDAA